MVTSRLLRSLVTLLSLMLPCVAAAQSNCFTQADNKLLTLDVFQIYAPPEYSAGGREALVPAAGYPGTDYATSMNRLTAELPRGAPYRRYYMLWANRCAFVEGQTQSFEDCRNVSRTKGNGYPKMVGGPLSQQVRTIFTSYRKANLCTILSARKALGESLAVVTEEGRRHDLRVVEANAGLQPTALARKEMVGRPASPQTVITDTCIVEEESVAPDVQGILLDYEVFDYRSPAEATAFLRDLHKAVASYGKKLIVNTNPLPRAPNGMTEESAREILGVVDGLIPTISSGASLGNPAIGLASKQRQSDPIENYHAQLKVLTRNGTSPLTASERSKVSWNISLFDTTLDEARFFNDETRKQGYRGVMLFRNFVKLGGACDLPSNQVIACLTMGSCDGHFGAGR